MKLAQLTTLLLISVPAPLPAATGVGDCQPGAVLESYFDAFNAHSVDGIMSLIHDEFQWIFLTGDQAAVEISGPEQLRSWLEQYFLSTPGARSTLEHVISDGCLASTRERAYWSSGDSEKSQTALASYQIRNGKILRIWYLNDSD
ncbi:MAG: nuclear transport factor 2 family protein [Xanthomonadales bacterium]|nr:nuclear transport factor 2 family protein [Xanthomonadales bacterium]